MSSSQSPPANGDHSTVDVSQPQTIPDQPTQVQVPPAPSPPKRPQAQVRSIQVIGQTTTGNPSPQTNAAAQPVQHIPIVFIKQEPVDEQHDAQCLFSTNSQRQNAFIIRTGPPVQNPSPLQLLEKSVIQLGDTPPSNPPSTQSPGQGSQAVTNAASSSNQPSTAGSQTTALLQQRAQTLRTPSVSQQGGQTTTPSVGQTPQSQTGAAADQSGREVSPKSKEVKSRRKSTESVQEMALKTLSRYTTDYKIGKTFRITPLK